MPTAVARTPYDINQDINSWLSSSNIDINRIPKPNFVKPPTTPPTTRVPYEIRQNTLSSVDASMDLSPTELDNFIAKVGGQSANWHIPNPPPPNNPTLTKDQIDKIAFYDVLNAYFGNKGLDANTLKNTWEDLKKWPDTFPLNTLKDVKDRFDDDVKWTTVFAHPLNPQSVKTKYDELKETHTAVDLKPADYDKTKADLKLWTDTFGTDTAQQVKAKIDAKPAGTAIGADEKVVKINDWNELSKRPTPDQLNQAVQVVKDSYKNVVPKADLEKANDIIKDYEEKVPKIMKLIKKHTNN